MVTIRKTWIYAAAAFTLGYLLIGARPLSAQGDCKLVLDAMIKVVSTPTHLYATMNLGGKDQAVETIYAGGGIYTRLDGKWSRSTMTMQDMAELQQRNLHNNNATTCKYLKDELVNGEMTALYSSHDVSPKGVTVTQTWISKSKSLPLRQETDIDVGGGKGKSHMSSRYEYANVKAPM
jgi:hypothetical protein